VSVEAELAQQLTQTRQLTEQLEGAERRGDELNAAFSAARDEWAGLEAQLRSLQAALEQEQRRGAEREQTLARERTTRKDVEQSVASLEASLEELSQLGDAAVQELDAARSEADRQATEARRWRALHQELEQTLDEERKRQQQAAKRSGARDEQVLELEQALARAEQRCRRLESERARLQIEADSAADRRGELAAALHAAEQVQGHAHSGMQLVLGRLETERERADQLESEAAELRSRLQERTDQIVRLTREASREADQARESRRELRRVTAQLEQARQQAAQQVAEREATQPASGSSAQAQQAAAHQVEQLTARLEACTASWQQAEDRCRALADNHAVCRLELEELREQQAAGQRRMVALEAEWQVARWDEQILRQQLESERTEQPRQPGPGGTPVALQKARRRLATARKRVRWLEQGARAHRTEMAEREIRLAEQRAWNQELLEEQAALKKRLFEEQSQKQAFSQALERALSDARRRSAEIAQLQGVLQRCQLEMQELQELQARARPGSAGSADSPDSVDSVDSVTAPRPDSTEEAGETAPAEMQALQTALAERESRIEDLEAVLDTLRRERDSLRREGEQQAGELQRLRERLASSPRTGAGSVPRASERLEELEGICQEEQQRLAQLGRDLDALSGRSRTLVSDLEAERSKARELAEQRAFFESQARRVPELELEMELLRTQEGSLAAPRELTERLTALESRVAEQQAAVQRSEARVSELNNLVGEKEAEILLLHAQNEGMQKQAGLLLDEVRKALVSPEAADPGQTRYLLGRLRAELERMT
jgi:chromosome segregation ATPase